MPSIGHLAVGLAAARRTREASGFRLPLLLCAVSLLPDADAIGFAYGVRYAAPWGHRGATHSLAFALGLALLAAPLSRFFKLSKLRLFTLVLCVAASHGLLDTLTDGGRGIALLWPFKNTRFFAPWRPIPVAPIGARILSPRGVYVVGYELVLFAPLFIYAVWPRRARARTAFARVHDE